MWDDVADMLREEAMPAEEIHEILATDDPRVVRRYFELHAERLDERLAEQRKRLVELERTVIGVIDERRRVA